MDRLTTDETRVLQSLLLLILLCPKGCKGVNNNTKNEVLDDDEDHQEKEGEIVEHAEEEHVLLTGKKRGSRDKVHW